MDAPREDGPLYPNAVGSLGARGAPQAAAARLHGQRVVGTAQAIVRRSQGA